MAHSHGMQVLVTMNILIKNCELSALIDTLAALEDIGVDAIIVQDVGLARICRDYFPHLRLHASTQLAVHNLDGVREAAALGFKRVVLARELTALEIKKIRAAVSEMDVELEAFCHGSLCYSYSGLCFFSGAEDARSGNRGECAYTCRKPYKILNEPGHGFLFSMKDLNTLESLDLLVDAGVDTLKIEGRKKDAQYVSQVVRAYRHKLDEIFERPTLRPTAPAIAHDLYGSSGKSQEEKEKSIDDSLKLTFQRNSTSFFLKGRYHENVIDLDNPTHKGQPVGVISSIDRSARTITLTTSERLERFDGLRIDPKAHLYHASPQHGASVQGSLEGVQGRYNNKVCQFSIRTMFQNGKIVAVAVAGSTIEIEIPTEVDVPSVGDHIFRTRSDALRRRVEQLSRPHSDFRLRPQTEVEFLVGLSLLNQQLTIKVQALKHGHVLSTCSLSVEAIRPQSGESSLTQDLREMLTNLGNIGFTSHQIRIEGDAQFFVPRSRLKQLRRNIEAELPKAHAEFLNERRSIALERVVHQRVSGHRADQRVSLALKIDRLEYLPWIADFIKNSSGASNSENTSDSHQPMAISELVFEPKRAFLPELSFNECIDSLLAFSAQTGVRLRLALPTVLRAWDEPLMKRWAQHFFASGICDVEIGNISHPALLERWGLKQLITSMSSDFTLYALNQEAAALWGERRISTITLSIEDDASNIKDLLNGFPEGCKPQSILYKDTPLFIAESCSLTALHDGCPTSKVCGYRTLEIQNDAGDVFYVAHESCKSIVYGKQPYSVCQHRDALEQAGVRLFRADFLTRLYDKESMTRILSALREGTQIADSHSANFKRRLL